MLEKACALTGHRELPADFDFNGLYYALADLAEEGYRTFYCGMAMGFDLEALKCLAALKKNYPLRLVACIPHPGQSEKFPKYYKDLYETLLPVCDDKVIVSPFFHRGVMEKRNRYMVDRADMVYAYCVKPHGGTFNTVTYAEKTGKPVCKFEPK